MHDRYSIPPWAGNALALTSQSSPIQAPGPRASSSECPHNNAKRSELLKFIFYVTDTVCHSLSCWSKLDVSLRSLSVVCVLAYSSIDCATVTLCCINVKSTCTLTLRSHESMPAFDHYFCLLKQSSKISTMVAGAWRSKEIVPSGPFWGRMRIFIKSNRGEVKLWREK